ncbi:MAG: hypothetical protein AAFV80_21280 [Bacteroidota bacterium]
MVVEQIEAVNELVFSKLEIVSRPLEANSYIFQLDENHAISFYYLSLWLPARLVVKNPNFELEIRRRWWFTYSYEVKNHGQLILIARNSWNSLRFEYQGQQFYTERLVQFTNNGLLVYRQGDANKHPILKLSFRLKKLQRYSQVIINEKGLDEMFLQAVIATCYYYLHQLSQSG